MYISCNDILIGSLFYKGVWVWGKLFLTLKLFVQVLGMQFDLQFVLLFLLLFTEISGLCNIYSAIHKAAGSLVTGCSQKTTGQNAPPPGHSCQQLPLTANGHFSVPQELYQWKSWNGRELWGRRLCE